MLGLELDENGQHDVLNIIGTSFFDVFTEVEFHIDPDFTPTPGDTFDFINLRDPTTGDTQHLLALIITPQGGIDVGAQGDFANFDPEQITILETPVTPGQVPEPGTWILIATSLLGPRRGPPSPLISWPRSGSGSGRSVTPPAARARRASRPSVASS